MLKYVPQIREAIQETDKDLAKLPAFNPKNIVKRRFTRSMSKKGPCDWDEDMKTIKNLSLANG